MDSTLTIDNIDRTTIIVTLLHENNILKNKYDTLKIDYELLKNNTILKYEREITTLQNENTSLTNQIENLTIENKLLKDQIENLTSLITTIILENKDLKLIVNDLKNDKKEIQIQNKMSDLLKHFRLNYLAYEVKNSCNINFGYDYTNLLTYIIDYNEDMANSEQKEMYNNVSKCLINMGFDNLEIIENIVDNNSNRNCNTHIHKSIFKNPITLKKVIGEIIIESKGTCNEHDNAIFLTKFLALIK